MQESFKMVRMSKRWWLAFFTGLLVTVVAGCSGSSGSVTVPDPLPSPPPTVDQVALQAAFPNLSFSQPVAMHQAPGDPSRWFLVERGGRIVTFANDAATNSADQYANLGSIVNNTGEGGLLGLAFHPDYASNRAVFITYTGGTSLQSRVSGFFANPDGLTLNENSETILITQDEPFTNHNIGNLVFGPGPASSDQYLYVGLGDGGGGGDPNNNSQNPFNFHGTILRVDVSGLTAYSIPPDNPFASGSNAAPEVFAYGLRNPWRFSFDRADGTLWAGDVGQNAFEEIDIITAGGNYGWRCYEGNAVYDSSGCPGPDAFIFPVVDYAHPAGGASVTGGYVYRGNGIEGLQGAYIFGDFISGTIWGLFPEANNQYRLQRLLESGLNIVSFAQDAAGELYVLDFSGSVYRIIAST